MQVEHPDALKQNFMKIEFENSSLKTRLED